MASREGIIDAGAGAMEFDKEKRYASGDYMSLNMQYELSCVTDKITRANRDIVPFASIQVETELRLQSADRSSNGHSVR